ncbi:MAG: hypothetical protein AB1640_04180 [bacterium]
MDEIRSCGEGQGPGMGPGDLEDLDELEQRLEALSLSSSAARGLSQPSVWGCECFVIYLS